MITKQDREFISLLAKHTNIIAMLADDPENNLYYAFTTFEGASKSNIGSVESNMFRGVDITDFVRNNITNPVINAGSVSGTFMNFIDAATAVVQTVKFANNMRYLTFNS